MDDTYVLSNKDLKKIEPASGAIIMGIGIFLYATINAFPILDHWLGRVLSVVLLILASVIFTALAYEFAHRDRLIPLLKQPVNSFAIGTWIAGISVLCDVVIKYFPLLREMILIISIVNTIFWLFFFMISVHSFIQLWKSPMSHHIHGIILLSTVSTQSLVIIWGGMFPFLPEIIGLSGVILGIIFYLCGILLIGNRYRYKQSWSLMEDWTNTNCIIHGALSITGLAIVSIQIMSGYFMMIFWLLVFTLLIFVETLEIIRAVKRVRNFGWRRGILSYQTSQWSRNFTFGMFYAFSITMHENSHYMNAIYSFQESFLTFWAWVVLLFLVAQIGLWYMARWHLFTNQTNEKSV